MKYKICKLSWTDDQYAVLSSTDTSGWVYVAKYLTKEEAEKLLHELQTIL